MKELILKELDMTEAEVNEALMDGDERIIQVAYGAIAKSTYMRRERTIGNDEDELNIYKACYIDDDISKAKYNILIAYDVVESFMDDLDNFINNVATYEAEANGLKLVSSDG